jgi:integrase
LNLRPTEPWVPRTFSVWVTKKKTSEWVEDRATAQRRRRQVDCWDVGGRADGVQWLKRFPKAGLAQAWKEQVERDVAAGLSFDLEARRFVVPETPAGPKVPTVFELTELYYRAHPEWEPKTKVLAAMGFGRARRWLLAGGVEPEGADLEAVDDFVLNGSFLPEHLSHELTDRQAAGRKWLMENSASADALSTGQIEEFVRRFEVNQRDPSKRVSAATTTRFLQPLKACWTWAVGRDDIPIDRNPWLTIKPRRKVKGKNTLAAGRGALAVDADMVIGVPEAFALAEACVEHGAWGGVVECFILVMALCGLRPGEAAGLLWDDLDLPSGGGAGWVTVRRTHRPVAARWLDPGEDPDWGPLKDRDIADTRRAPVHPTLVEKLLRHRELYGVGPDGLVFHRNGKPFDPDMFNKSVWHPGRAALWPLRIDIPAGDPRQPKLAKLRRHDLRHAACSWWLREGVDAVVCQRWSGHKTLSVFLDIYQGVAPGREDEGVKRLVACIRADSTTTPI